MCAVELRPRGLARSGKMGRARHRGLPDATWSLVVLHDLPTGAMAHLDRFIRALQDDGVDLAEDYPPECVPIADGKIMLPLDQFVAEEAI